MDGRVGREWTHRARVDAYGVKRAWTIPLRRIRIAVRTGAYKPRAGAMSGPRYGGRGRSKCRIRN
jgi:hypothetical protein